MYINLHSSLPTYNTASCGRHGFTIEVGPTPQGVLRHDVVEKTQTAMHALMEFLHLRNLELANNATNNSDEIMPPSILDQLKTLYPGGIVPCYRSAPAVRPGELSGKISWPNDESNPNFPTFRHSITALCSLPGELESRGAPIVWSGKNGS